MGFDGVMIERLLERARVNNQVQNVTGLLCFDGESFVQILEGNEGNVERVYSQICKDARHGNIRRIYSGNIAERNFQEWSMGYFFASPLTGDVFEQAWKKCDEQLDVSGRIESRGVAFFKHLKKSLLKQTPEMWD